MVIEVCPNCRGVIEMECTAAEVNSQQMRKCANFSTINCQCHDKLHIVGPSERIVPSLRHSFSRSCQYSNSGPRTAFKLFIWIFLVFPLSTMSNPVPLQDQEAGPSTGHHHKSKRPHDRPMKWVNPCRIPSALPAFQMDMDIEIITQSDTEIISNIITQVNKAEHQSRRFMEQYYRETFGEDLKERDKFSEVHYDFLKEINEKVKKSLGDKLSRNELEELKMDETLRSMYAGLQMYAVGLEQIVLDQSVYGGSFHKEFQETEYQLKYVLCELQIAMLEKGIQHEDITREIMSGDYRDIDCDTIRNIRDWVIFRDYVITLEYIQQSFSYFLDTVESR